MRFWRHFLVSGLILLAVISGVLLLLPQRINPAIAGSQSYTPTDIYLVPFWEDIIAAQSISEIEKTLNKFIQEQGVAVSLKTPSSSGYRLDSLNADDLPALKVYAQLLITELNKYDRAWMQKGKIERIFLAKNIRTPNGQPIDGTVNYSQNAVYFDITASQQTLQNFIVYPLDSNHLCGGEVQVRALIHHELWHLYEFYNPQPLEHTEWKTHNHQDYNPNAEFETSLCGGKNDSFISSYAGLNYHEDRAIMFSLYMMNELFEQSSEPNLFSKQELIKRHAPGFVADPLTGTYSYRAISLN